MFAQVGIPYETRDDQTEFSMTGVRHFFAQVRIPRKTRDDQTELSMTGVALVRKSGHSV